MYQGVTRIAHRFRARFVLNWYNSEGKNTPFAYLNITGSCCRTVISSLTINGSVAPSSIPKYSIWVQNHSDDVKSFQQFQRNVLFKKFPANNIIRILSIGFVARQRCIGHHRCVAHLNNVVWRLIISQQ